MSYLGAAPAPPRLWSLWSAIQARLDSARMQTILGRRVPERWIKMLQEQGHFRKLWASGDVVRIDDLVGDGSLRPRIAW